VGFYDGILVGANANARSNVLVNIVGDTGGWPNPQTNSDLFLSFLGMPHLALMKPIV
jgi:hypothetical protein